MNIWLAYKRQQNTSRLKQNKFDLIKKIKQDKLDQERAGGESCTPGTELELGENIVDSYGKVLLSESLDIPIFFA